MDIAALITWIITAGGGFYLLATWIAKGGARRDTAAPSRFPPALIFGHMLLAAVGLVVWIVYVVVDKTALAWISFALLAVVALAGFTMFGRWLPTYRATRVPVTSSVQSGEPSASRDTVAPAGTTAPAERHFPVAIVGLHGLLAATTLILVLLTALNVGGS